MRHMADRSINASPNLRSYELSRNYESAEFSPSPARKGMVLPFTPLAMSFLDVNYYVDMPAVSFFLSIFCFHKAEVNSTLQLLFDQREFEYH